MTYTEACDSLFTMIENAIFDYECECVLTEDAGEGNSSTKVSDKENDKKQSLLAKIWAGIKKILEIMKNAIKAGCTWIMEKIKNVYASRGSAPLIATTDFEVSMMLNLDKMTGAKYADKFIDNMLQLRPNDIKAVADVEDGAYELFRHKDTIPAGTKLKSSNEYLKILKNMHAYVDRLNIRINKVKEVYKYNGPISETLKFGEITELNKLIKIINKEMNAYIQDIKTILTNSSPSGNLDNKVTANNIRHGSNIVKAAKMDAKSDKIASKYESVDIDSISALRAKCLIEAANILAEDTAIQKDVEDIPEEKPAVAPEYPEDTSGGEGIPEDFLDDVKDIIDDDKDALDLLTDDEDKSLTIEESVNLLLDL